MNTIALVSGGVDSSVALRMLCDRGDRPVAVYLKIWLEDELSYLGDCPWEEDLSYVRATCSQLGVPLEVISLQKEYHALVVERIVESVAMGFTPNPDILCNQQIKFGAAYAALGPHVDTIVTGHYASSRRSAEGAVELIRAVDELKDQTYFLALLNQQQLAAVEFPLGVYTKSEVRAFAVKHNLPSAHRRDSQGICFLGKISYPEFLRYHLGVREGVLVEYETGAVCGMHQGHWFYTIGQRSGIGLSGGPWYVVAKNVSENSVYISKAYYEHSFSRELRRTFEVIQPHWISGVASQSRVLEVKTRHGAHTHMGSVEYQSDGSMTVLLDRDDQGIASGQYAVFYEGDVCLGGGVMMQRGK